MGIVVTVSVLVLAFAVLVFAAIQLGGVSPLWVWLNGEAVFIRSTTMDFGSCEAGAEMVAVFKMQNLTSKEVSVVGEKSSCSCAFSEKIPISIPAWQTADIRIGVHLPKYTNSYDQTVLLMVAEPKRLALHPVRIVASIPNPLPRPAETPEPDDSVTE